MQRSAVGGRWWIATLGVAMLVWFAGSAADPGDLRPLPEPTDGHRVLRDNAPRTMPTPTTPETFAGFPDAPPFEVVPREAALTHHPCSMCHQHLPTNPEPRKLVAAPHPAALDHGDGRFWCLQCHAEDNRDRLQLLDGQQVGFDESWQLCGQCHYEPQRDWARGAHGKRVSHWQGDRTLYSCTHCHDPHDPGIAPRAPEPPPPVRRGLEPMHAATPDRNEETDHAAGGSEN